eukprot:1596301-Alexandrium_andersonii.AAC.1
MSASLVGSEMCIRDSARKAVASRRISSSQNLSSSAAAWNTLIQGAPSICLLYTSDAADDM